jgi:hypothetical protein
MILALVITNMCGCDLVLGVPTASGVYVPLHLILIMHTLDPPHCYHIKVSLKHKINKCVVHKSSKSYSNPKKKVKP